MTDLNFDAARILNDNGLWLCLRVKDAAPARRFVSECKGLYTATIKRFRKPRSLDANAYFWVLCDKLAQETGQTKTDIYRACIKEIGGVSDTVCVREKAADKLISGWQANGIGWMAEKDKSKIPGCVNVILYYGSSTYDTVQMSRLIDLIVQECRQQDIETMTPLELERLKEDWMK